MPYAFSVTISIYINYMKCNIVNNVMFQSMLSLTMSHGFNGESFGMVEFPTLSFRGLLDLIVCCLRHAICCDTRYQVMLRSWSCPAQVTLTSCKSQALVTLRSYTVHTRVMIRSYTGHNQVITRVMIRSHTGHDQIIREGDLCNYRRNVLNFSTSHVIWRSLAGGG
jgi:hypothetical protein